MSIEAAVIVAIAVVVLPGFLIALASGVKAPAAVAAGVPVTFGVAGLASWSWGAIHVPFNWLTFLVTWFVVLALVCLWRTVFALRARRRSPGLGWRGAYSVNSGREASLRDPSWILPALGVIAGAWLLISNQLRWLKSLPNGVNNIFQGWDGQWHANLVRFIMDEGIASPTRMGELQNLETHAEMLYPSAFHAVTALFGEAAGLDPIPAVNLASIVVPGIALPLTMACLVWVMVGNRGLVFQIGAGIAAIGIFAAPSIAWVGHFVGAWPYVSAMSLTGIVIAQFVAVPRNRVTAAAAVLGFLGIIQVHPASVTVVAIAVALFWLFYLLWAPATTRIKDFVWLVLPAVVGAVLYLPQVLAGSAQAEDVADWGRASKLSHGEAWHNAFFMQTRHVDDFFPNFDPTTILWLALIGALFIVFKQRLVWVGLTYVVLLASTAQAFTPFDDWLGDALGIITAFHYNEAHRLVMPESMFLIAAAGIGVAVLIRVLTLAPVAARQGTPGWLRTTGVLAVVVALFAGWGAMWWVTETTQDAARAAFKSGRLDERMVNDNDLAAFDFLGSQPAAYEGLTMGEPADGHSWLYAYNGVPTVSRHYQRAEAGPGSATQKLTYYPQLLGEGVRGDADAENEVDRAAEELDVRFFLLSPRNFWGAQQVRLEMLRGLWAADGATPIFRKGTTVVFAVNAAFTQAELDQLRANAEAAGSDPVRVEEPDSSS